MRSVKTAAGMAMVVLTACGPEAAPGIDTVADEDGIGFGAPSPHRDDVEEDNGPEGDSTGADADGQPCDDGNPCTLDDILVDGICVGSTNKPCDDPLGQPCMAGVCEPATGECVLQQRDDGSKCGVACRSGLCFAGVCDYGPDQCKDSECVDSQCNLMTGVCGDFPLSGSPCVGDGDICSDHVCDAGTCLATPRCSGAVEDCMVIGCDGETGDCVPTTAAIDHACDDGDACTEADTCVDDGMGRGECLGGAIDCDDGIACTYDYCSVDAGGCVNDPNAALCDDDNTCTIDSCSATGQGLPDTGCQFIASVGETCNDGSPCTTGDTCSEGGMCVGDLYDCDDGLDCTVDSCDGDGGCNHEPIEDHCVIAGACVAAGTAAPGAPCMACLPDLADTTWAPLHDGAACDDGSLCTSSWCEAGSCVGAFTGCPVVTLNGDPGGHQTEPAAATLSSGKVVAAWTTKDTGNTEGHDVVYRLFGADLTAIAGFGVEQPAAVATAGHQQAPAVAALAGGGFVIAWQSADGDGKFEIRHRVFDASGAAVNDGEIQVSTSTHTEKQPAIAALPGGRFVITWTDVGSTYDLKARLVGADGYVVGPELAIAAGSGGQSEPVAAAVGEDLVAFAWKDGGDVMTCVHHVEPDGLGALAAGPELVNQEAVSGTQRPTGITRTNNGYVIVWQDDYLGDHDGNQRDLRAREFDLEQSYLLDTFTVAEGDGGDQSEAALCPLTEGFEACWTADGEILGRRFIEAGVPATTGGLGTGEQLVSDAALNHGQPVCSPLPDQPTGLRAVVVWSAKVDKLGWQIHARVIEP